MIKKYILTTLVGLIKLIFRKVFNFKKNIIYQMNHILIQRVLNISTMKLINVLYTLNTVVVEALYMWEIKIKKL